MKKRIGIAIIIMVTVILGGFVYAYAPQSESQQSTSQNIPDGATGVTFQNNGDSWTHVVAAFDITQTDGTVKNVYTDLWVKPKGTANVDLSGILGYANQALPEGTKIQLKTYTDPNVPASEAPQGATDSQVTTTTDPAQGGDFLAALTPRVSALDPIVSTPRQTVIANTIATVLRGGNVVVSASTEAPLCVVASAGRASAVASTTGPVIARTSRLTIVLPF